MGGRVVREVSPNREQETSELRAEGRRSEPSWAERMAWPMPLREGGAWGVWGNSWRGLSEGRVGWGGAEGSEVRGQTLRGLWGPREEGFEQSCLHRRVTLAAVWRTGCRAEGGRREAGQGATAVDQARDDEAGGDARSGCWFRILAEHRPDRIYDGSACSELLPCNTPTPNVVA